MQPATPFIVAFENFTLKMEKAVRSQKFAYFGKTNVHLILEHLYTVCEQTFSLMNFSKIKQHSSLTNGHVEDL